VHQNLAAELHNVSKIKKKGKSLHCFGGKWTKDFDLTDHNFMVENDL